MPRVPVYERQVRLKPMPTPSVRPDYTPGLQQLGQAIAGLGQDIFRLATEMRDRADSLRADRALLEFNRIRGQLTFGENGVRLRQGENALDFSADVEKLRKAAAEIEASLANERQRELFRQRALPMFDQTVLDWEKHSAKQFQRLFSETAEARTQLALERAGAAETPADVERELAEVLWEPDPDNPDQLRPGIFVRNLTENLGVSHDRVKKLTDDLRREAHVMALTRLVDEGRIAEASAYLKAELGPEETVESFLGAKGRHISRSIRAAEAKLFAATKADEIIAAVSDPEEGFVDEARAIEELNKLPPHVREQVRPVLRAAMADAARRKEARVAEVYGRVFEAYSKGGMRAVDAKDMAWLDVHAPKLSGGLRLKDQRRWQEMRRDAAEARRIQRELNMIAMNEFMALPVEERATANLVVMFGNDVDEVGMSALRAAQRKAIEQVERGEAVREAEFRRDGLARAQGIIKGKSKLKTFEAELTIAYDEFRAQHNRPPNREEAEQIYDSLIRYEIGKQRGYEVRAKRRQAQAKSRTPERFTMEPSEPPRASKRIVRYLVSPDGTRRVPVYEDGTFGEEEIFRR